MKLFTQYIKEPVYDTNKFKNCGEFGIDGT